MENDLQHHEHVHVCTERPIGPAPRQVCEGVRAFPKLLLHRKIREADSAGAERRRRQALLQPLRAPPNLHQIQLVPGLAVHGRHCWIGVVGVPPLG